MAAQDGGDVRAQIEGWAGSSETLEEFLTALLIEGYRTHAAPGGGEGGTMEEHPNTRMMHLNLKLPQSLHTWLKRQAQINRRSLQGEIVFRLESSQRLNGHTSEPSATSNA